MKRVQWPLLGFCGAYVLGFVACLLLLGRPSPPEETLSMASVRPPAEDRYRDWLATQGVRNGRASADAVSYGNASAESEAAFLFARVNVACVVFARKGKKARAIEQTWGRGCNRLEFFAAAGSHLQASDLDVRLVQKPKSSWHLLCSVINQVWHSSGKELQWVIFLPEDLFVLPENLRLLVAPLDANAPYYLGHAMSLWNEDYNVAQAGYVLSKGALKLIVDRFNSSQACEDSGKHWKNEDFYLGKYLGEAGVSPEDTRDHRLRGRFHGFNLNQMLFSHKLSPLGSYWKRSIYPVDEGLNCCSDSSITFQGVEPDKVFQFHYLLYRVKRFAEKGGLGNLPAPTPLPGNEPWRVFLRDEQLWDRPGEDISADQYYRLSSKIASKLSVLHYKHL
ncbi:Hypothetical predicted protein [Cloeon dipterum]|uniref:Hexosyltransferase n=1 Tax=Cloeon dipterum TaxID=197152 RepID=A0A8S1CTT4_9INSE|nr:Hypothetical predicted protein [Cloeon dipterum]